MWAQTAFAFIYLLVSGLMAAAGMMTSDGLLMLVMMLVAILAGWSIMINPDQDKD